MIFRYAALEVTSGQELRGELNAADPPAAAADLRRRGLLPIELTPAPEAAHTAQGGIWPVGTRDVVLLFRQLALMLRSGLTILQALEVAAQLTPKRKLAQSLVRVRSAVETGSSLSDAFAREPKVIPQVGVRLVRAAEQAGELASTFDQVAAHVERSHELRMNVLTSLMYPGIVVLISTGVIVFLVTKVIPTFAKFLQRRHVALPWATKRLLEGAELLTTYGPALAVAAVAMLVAILIARRFPEGRRKLDRLVLAVPLIGGLLQAGAMAQLGRTFAMLLRGGVTLLEALRVLSGTVLNAAISAQLEAAADACLRGRDLASGLRHPTIPPLVAQLVATGEQTGALDAVLEEVGRFYEEELRRRVKQLTSLFEPAVIIVIGGLVGFVYFAFFQALFQLASSGR